MDAEKPRLDGLLSLKGVIDVSEDEETEDAKSAAEAAVTAGFVQALKGLSEGGGFWWLGGISFLYGIVHAAGPGHGKVVISTYLVANEARVRRGVAIAFIAAFVQAVWRSALSG